jgi:hypothetical protein
VVSQTVPGGQIGDGVVDIYLYRYYDRKKQGRSGMWDVGSLTENSTEAKCINIS